MGGKSSGRMVRGAFSGYLPLMSRYDLTTRAGRFKAHWDYVWKDHAFLRRWFSNAHWLGPDLVRTNQPSPRQLAYWKS